MRVDRADDAMQAIAQAVLETPGDTDADLRAAVYARAAARSGVAGALPELPANLDVFVDKLALHAYKIVDRDIDALRAAGYSEDAVFEIIVAGATAAGMTRLQGGLQALGEALAQRGHHAAEES